MYALKYLSLLLITLLLVSCRTDKEVVLVKNDLFSEEGLRKWNAATVAALEIFSTTYGEEYKDSNFIHWLNNPHEDTIISLRRKEYFDLLRESKAVADSIRTTPCTF